MNGIFWLDEIIVKAIHEDQLIQHGGLAAEVLNVEKSGTKFDIIDKKTK